MQPWAPLIPHHSNCSQSFRCRITLCIRYLYQFLLPVKVANIINELHIYDKFVDFIPKHIPHPCLMWPKLIIDSNGTKKVMFGLQENFFFRLSCLKCYGRMEFLLRYYWRFLRNTLAEENTLQYHTLCCRRVEGNSWTPTSTALVTFDILFQTHII